MEKDDISRDGVGRVTASIGFDPRSRFQHVRGFRGYYLLYNDVENMSGDIEGIIYSSRMFRTFGRFRVHYLLYDDVENMSGVYRALCTLQ